MISTKHSERGNGNIKQSLTTAYGLAICSVKPDLCENEDVEEGHEQYTSTTTGVLLDYGLWPSSSKVWTPPALCSVSSTSVPSVV